MVQLQFKRWIPTGNVEIIEVVVLCYTDTRWGLKGSFDTYISVSFGKAVTNKAQKRFWCSNGVRTHDLRDTGAVKPRRKQAGASSIYIHCVKRMTWSVHDKKYEWTAEKYDLYHNIQLTSLSSYNGYKWNSHLTCFPRGFIAQSVEHRISIAKVMGSNPVVVFSGFYSQLWRFLSHLFFIRSALIWSLSYKLQVIT